MSFFLEVCSPLSKSQNNCAGSKSLASLNNLGNVFKNSHVLSVSRKEKQRKDVKCLPDGFLGDSHWSL